MVLAGMALRQEGGVTISGWSAVGALLDWLLWGFGYSTEPPDFPHELNETLYRQMNLGPMLVTPHDYFGEWIAMQKGNWNPNAFYPTPHSLPKDFWDRPLRDLFQTLQTTPAGLSSDEAKRRLRLSGPNSFVQESRFAALVSFLRLVANPLIIILLLASGVSLALGDPIGGLIIISIVLLSVLLNFSMEFQARHAVEKIRKQVATTAAVIRDGREQELLIAELVPGDIIRLRAGDLVPADARLLKLTDLHVRESALTGESLPVEKPADDLPLGIHGVTDASNSVFLGSAVQTGIGTAVIVCTGRDTAFGRIAQRLAMRPPETEFGRGIRHFGIMITWITMLLVLFVLLVNIILHRPLLESFLFSVALAVGMTPEMMPMIITVTLAQGGGV